MGSSSQLLAESRPPLSVPLQLQLSVRFAASDSTLISPALPSVSCKICNRFPVSLSRGNRARGADGAEVERTRRELHHGPCRHLHSHYRRFPTECGAVRTSSPAAIKLSLQRKLTDQSDDCLTQQRLIIPPLLSTETWFGSSPGAPSGIVFRQQMCAY